MLRKNKIRDIKESLLDNTSPKCGSPRNATKALEGGSMVESGIFGNLQEDEYFSMVKNLIDDDDVNISTADGLLEFFKKVKNPDPVEDLYMDQAPFGLCRFKDT